MARRRRSRNRLANSIATLAAIVGWALAASRVGHAIDDYPTVAAAVITVWLAAVGAWGYAYHLRGRRLAAAERSVAVTDTMSGTEFEHYVARLMRASGCRRVRVSGGTNDMGADVTGNAPDGRRVVVQCKRYRGSLGSPDVQRFAGTARDVHCADLALLVTTGRPTAQAVKVARLCHITLIDRPALGRWVSGQTSPFDGRPTK